jgi:hypothetical protein
MSNHRWSKFVWTDYDNDRALRKCSLAAQGLWMRLLCIAHDATPRGYVLIDGRKPTAPELTRLVGVPDLDGRLKPHWRTLDALIKELCDARVCDLDPHGVIVNRRMIRDEAAYEVAVKSGKLGGNPNLLRNKNTKDTVKGSDYTEDKAESDSNQTPESESPPSPRRGGGARRDLIKAVQQAAAARAPQEEEHDQPFRPKLIAGGKAR